MFAGVLTGLRGASPARGLQQVQLPSCIRSPASRRLLGVRPGHQMGPAEHQRGPGGLLLWPMNVSQLVKAERAGKRPARGAGVQGWSE